MKKFVLIILMSVSLIVLYTLFGMKLSSIQYIMEITRWPLLFITVCILFFFGRKCFYWYSNYMLSWKGGFKKDIDRPRVYVFSVLFPVLAGLCFHLSSSHPFFLEDNPSLLIQGLFVLYYSVLLSLFAFLSYLLFLSLFSKFEMRFLGTMGAIEKIVERFNQDFKSSIEPDRVGRIFDRLVKYGFFEYEDLEEQNEKRKVFIEVFVTGNTPENRLFKLNMDNIQTHYFYTKIEQELEGFTLSHLLKILGNNNKRASPNSIITSAGKAKSGAKDQNLIDAIFLDKKKVGETP